MTKILAIDDKPDNLLVLKAIFRNMMPECTLFTAQSGKNGLKIAEQEMPDTILLDVNMPGMNGFEVCQALRLNSKISHIPIILLTAVHKNAGSMAHGLEVGADAFLTKPIEEIELVAQVRAMLRIKKVEDILRHRLAAEEADKKMLAELNEHIVSSSPVGITIYNSAGDCLVANNAAAEIVGATQDQLLNQNYHQIEFWKISGLYQAALKALKSKKENHLELEVTTTFGKKATYNVYILPISAGSDCNLMLMIEDITVRKQAEKKLRQNEERYRSLINATTSVIWTTDATGGFVEPQPSWEKFTGQPWSEHKDYGWGEKIHPDDIERILQVWEKACEELSIYETWGRFWSANLKEWRNFEVSAIPIIDPDGSLLEWVGVMTDITSRKQAERELRLSAERFERWKSSNFIGIMHSDARGNIIDINDAMLAMLGYSKQDLAEGKLDWTKLTPPEFLHLDNKAMEEASKKGAWKPFEKEYFHKDGHRVPILIGGSVFKMAHDQYIVFIIDLTERKKIEEEKRNLESRLGHAQKMEAIGTLAGGIAHDFNNILGTIFGYVGLAMEDAPSGTRLKKQLDHVLIAAHRAKDLVKQILAFSRQVQIERIPIKIQPLIKEGITMLRSSIPTTISIVEDIDPKSGVVLADPTQIHQILMNLCTNAYHVMEKTGGTLSISLKTTVIESDEKIFLDVNPGEYIVFTVSDTGTGIGPDVIDKIFDPYFTTKETGKGTGMGLAIIHGIIKEYGGMITVESELDKGSTFHVYFPAVKEEALPELKETEDIPRGNERVLFIDDEELLAEVGQDMLERLGYHVTVRCSSIEALTTFQNSPDEFDIVITDQTMPDMTGSDLARQMIQIKPGIPIILCTGYSNLIDELSAKAMGIKEFALKPLTKDVIANLIRKVLDAS